MAATDWALRGSVALVFVIFGMEKLTGSGGWVKLFDQIGVGQWFRYFTGVLQVTGGALLLIPRTARLGTALLACTMIGAVFVNLFVLGTGFSAVIPGVLLALVVWAGWKKRAEPEQSLTLR